MKKEKNVNKKIYYILLFVTTFVICAWFFIIKINKSNVFSEVKKEFSSNKKIEEKVINQSNPDEISKKDFDIYENHTENVEDKNNFSKDSIISENMPIKGKIQELDLIDNYNANSNLENILLLNMIVIKFLRDIPCSDEIKNFKVNNIPFDVYEVVKLISEYNIIIDEAKKEERIIKYGILSNVVKITKFGDINKIKTQLRQKIINKLDIVSDFLYKKLKEMSENNLPN